MGSALVDLCCLLTTWRMWHRWMPNLEFTRKTVPDVLFDAIFGQLSAVEKGALSGEVTVVPTMKSYAILDASKVPNLPELLEKSGLEHRCLFKGRAYDELKLVAPWILQLKPDNSFVRSLFTCADPPWYLWDNEPGIYIRSCDTMDQLWRHLRKFTRIRNEDGNWLYFRFWDWDVLPSLADARSENSRWIGHLLGRSTFISVQKNGHVSLIRASDPTDLAQPLGDIVLGAELRQLLGRQFQWRRQNADICAVHAQLALWGYRGPASETQLAQTRAWLIGCGIVKRDHLIEAMSRLTIGFPGSLDDWPGAIRQLLSDRAKGPGVRVWYLRKKVLADCG